MNKVYQKNLAAEYSYLHSRQRRKFWWQEMLEEQLAVQAFHSPKNEVLTFFRWLEKNVTDSEFLPI